MAAGGAPRLLHPDAPAAATPLSCRCIICSAPAVSTSTEAVLAAPKLAYLMSRNETFRSFWRCRAAGAGARGHSQARRRVGQPAAPTPTSPNAQSERSSGLMWRRDQREAARHESVGRRRRAVHGEQLLIQTKAGCNIHQVSIQRARAGNTQAERRTCSGSWVMTAPPHTHLLHY